MIAPKQQPHTLQLSYSNKNNDLSDTSDVKNNDGSECSMSELSPFGFPDEICLPKFRAKYPYYVSDLVEARQQRNIQLFSSDEINKIPDRFLRFLKGPDRVTKLPAMQMVAEVQKMLLAINAFKVEDVKRM